MSVTLLDIQQTIARLCDIIIDNKTRFCELDSVAGDGDLGISLAAGFKEVKKQLADIDNSSISSFLRGCAIIIAEFCGGASGPIWSSAFSRAAGSVKEKDILELADIAGLFAAAVAAIEKLGNAKGNKTLLDALIPAAEALSDASNKGMTIRDAFISAAKKATEGAEATKNMVAVRGRAAYLGTRSLGYPDAGAMAISIIFNEFVK